MNFRQASATHFDIAPRQVLQKGRLITADDVRHYASLAKIGIELTPDFLAAAMDEVERIQAAFDGDDVGPLPATNPLNPTTASITTPVQFLQNWLPGFVNKITAARKADELMGIRTVGEWEDEQIVQGVMEPAGTATNYGDYTNVPFVSWNTNFDYRTVTRWEAGMLVGRLEQARASRIRVSSDAEKRALCAIALEIVRNRVAFYGYNDGSNKTYGFLNDPNLPSYQTVANGAAGHPQWSTKTFLEITADIRAGFAALAIAGQGRYNPEDVEVTLALAPGEVQYLTVVSDFGISVRDWIRQSYPKMRIAIAPELSAANGGADVFYMWPEEVNDGESSDDMRTIIQAVPAKFITLGVEKRMKGYAEDYSNATAGVFVKRPWAFYRASGVG